MTRPEVSFDTQGGSAAPSSRTVFADTIARGGRTMPADPTKADHDFVEWNTKADGTGAKVTDSLALPGSSADGAAVVVTAYAIWSEHDALTKVRNRLEQCTGTAASPTVITVAGDINEPGESLVVDCHVVLDPNGHDFEVGGIEVTANGKLTLANGIITAGELTGAGVIHNEGILRVDPAKVSVKVTGLHHEVVFVHQDGTTADVKRTVFAPFMRIAGVSMPSNPTWADHDFKGWNTKADGTGQTFSDLDVLAGSSTDGTPVVTKVHAIWSEHDPLTKVRNRLDQCTGTETNPTRITLAGDVNEPGESLVVDCPVVLDVDGHVFEVGGIEVTANGKLTLPEGIIKAGELTGAGVIHNEGILRVDPAKVSVKVTGLHHEVVFVHQDGTTVDVKRTVFAPFIAISSVSMPPNPTWADHDFKGWNTKADGTGQSFTNLDVLPGSSTDGTPVVTKVYAQWSEHDAFRKIQNRIDQCTGTETNATRVTLTQDVAAGAEELVVGCHVVLDVAGFDLDLGGIHVSANGSLTITGGTVTTGEVTGDGYVVNQGVLLADPAKVAVPVRERHYAVGFDTQGGSANPASVTVFADTLKAAGKAMPGAPTREGHDFVEWNTKADGTGAKVTDSFTLPGSSTDGKAVVVTAYAVWKKHPDPVVVPGKLTIERPTVTGTPRYLETLTAHQVLPDVPGVQVAYQWQSRRVLFGKDGKRTGFGPWEPVAGATQATYSPGLRTIRRQVRVVTTVSAPGHESATGRRFGGFVTKAVFAHPAKRLSLKRAKGRVRIVGLDAWLRPEFDGRRTRVTVRLRAPGYRPKGVISRWLRLT